MGLNCIKGEKLFKVWTILGIILIVMASACGVAGQGSLALTSSSRVPWNLSFGGIITPPASAVVNIDRTCLYNPTDFQRAGQAMEKILHFYDRNTEKIVLDAAVGLRIMQAALTMGMKGHKNLPTGLRGYLQTLFFKANDVSSDVIRSVLSNHRIPETSKRQGLPWVENATLWETPEVGSWSPNQVMQRYQKPSRLRAEKESLDEAKEKIDEKISDACIYQVFHCESVPVSNHCRDVFFTRPLSKYSLTHQVIYMILAEKRSCLKIPSFLANFQTPDWKGFREQLCGKVWREAHEIAQDGFPPYYRDLFTEQVGICALAGFEAFMKPEWFRKIFSWHSQSRSGCFLEPQKKFSIVEKLFHAFNSRRRPLGRSLQRMKRSDATIFTNNEKCSVHFTAVGAAAMSLFMRHFIDSCLSFYQ